MTDKKLDYPREQQAWKMATPGMKQRAFSIQRNFIMQDGKAYDIDTGEDISDKLDVKAILTEKQREGTQLLSELKEHNTENGGYVFAFFHFMTAISDRFPELSQSDMARLMFIGTYISYNEGDPSACFLQYDNGKGITRKNLNNLLEMSRNRYSEFFNKLIDSDIIEETINGITVNPAIFYRGENIKAFKGSHQYTRLFRKTARTLYHKFKGRSIKKLAILYTILPYVNFNFNIICNNPQQVKNGKIETMRLKDLAEKLGYNDYKHLIKIMNEIRLEEKPVFKFVDEGTDRRESYIIVNPNVVYAGNGTHLKAIKVLFQ